MTQCSITTGCITEVEKQPEHVDSTNLVYEVTIDSIES